MISHCAYDFHVIYCLLVTYSLHAYPKGTIYNASKFAVNGFTQAMRHDLNATPIRVCEIRPGAVNTEFSLVRFNGAQDTADKVYADLVPLVADDIADQVLCKHIYVYIHVNFVVNIFVLFSLSCI